MADDRLEKLKAKRQAIDNQIKDIENRKNATKRKTENRRKFLAGSAVLSEAEKDPAYKKNLYNLLGMFLTREADRALFDLPPLPPSPPAAVEGNKPDGK